MTAPPTRRAGSDGGRVDGNAGSADTRDDATSQLWTPPARRIARVPDRGAPPVGGRRGGAPGTLLGLHVGQIVVAQIAAALMIAGVGAAASGRAVGVLQLALITPVVPALLLLAFGRWRRRWVYQWIAQGSRFLARRRTLARNDDPAALFELLRPAGVATGIEVDGTPVGVIEDPYGLTAVLEIGDTTGLLADSQPAVPALASLLPPGGPDQPAVRLQLLVSGVAAPAARAGAGPAASSYRQLTEGRILAQHRVLLAVHIRRVGGFADPELQRSLASAVRRARRRMDRLGLVCRPLASDSVLRALAELAHHDGALPATEGWTAMDVGGMRQVSFRLTRWPDPHSALARTLLPRLLTLPSAGTTVSLAVERANRTVDLAPTEAGAVRAELVIRLAAPGSAALTATIDALRRLLGAVQARAQCLDGAQLDGLAATLPLGGAATGPGAALAGMAAGREGLGMAGAMALQLNTDALASIEVPVGGAGMMLGVNRRGEPVTLRLFRAEPTRAALIGGLRCAQVIALRALALGAQVVVQSGRPEVWEPFLRGVSGSADAVTLVAPGRIVEPPPATAVRPHLLVIDLGPIGATGVPAIESAWLTTLLLREELTASDLDLLARADVALLQPLSPEEARLAASGLGLGDAADWLTRIRGDMVAVVAGRRTLRWALLSGTPIEQQLIGPVTR
ncbi:MAG TPA: type VII secretion protein EccE [Micromonosporaceae bacterium]|nr:type VII secretion protein EccE [Micromonosporaceae bacterium]